MMFRNGNGRREAEGVTFEPPLPATVVERDGSRRAASVLRLSNSQARLAIDAGCAGLDEDFLLLLSSNGAVRRRCRLVSVYGNEMEAAVIGARALTLR
jgi:hypothetical protein